MDTTLIGSCIQKEKKCFLIADDGDNIEPVFLAFLQIDLWIFHGHDVCGQVKPMWIQGQREMIIQKKLKRKKLPVDLGIIAENSNPWASWKNNKYKIFGRKTHVVKHS